MKPKQCLQKPPVIWVQCSFIAIAEWQHPFCYESVLIGFVLTATGLRCTCSKLSADGSVSGLSHFEQKAFFTLKTVASHGRCLWPWVMALSSGHCSPWSMPVCILFLDRDQRWSPLHIPNSSRSREENSTTNNTHNTDNTECELMEAYYIKKRGQECYQWYISGVARKINMLHW